MSASITCEGAGVRFLFDRQRRPMTPAMARLRRRATTAFGLQDVDLRVGPGESVALAGANGAGKTTLLRLLAGVLRPDRGAVQVDGRVGSLLSIEGGLMTPLTGRENALLLAVLAGLSRAEAVRRLDDVRDLSELGASYDRPVSSYSQGMRARLGFAVVQRAKPDVLLLDEVHEALDHDFRDRVRAESLAVLARGGVLVAAGHDHAVLERLCARAVVLRQGRVIADGPIGDVLDRYRHESGVRMTDAGAAAIGGSAPSS